MAICWDRAVPLAFHLCSFYFSAVLIVGVQFPFGVLDRMWSSIVSVPDHCLFICFILSLSGIVEQNFVQMVRVAWPRWPPCL